MTLEADIIVDVMLIRRLLTKDEILQLFGTLDIQDDDGTGRGTLISNKAWALITERLRAS